KRAKAKLVYDAHELETDRNLPMVRFEKAYRSVAERLLIGQCDAVITVSDSIARYLAERYRIPTPIVVLNAPMTRADAACSDLRADLGLLPDQPLALYVGGLVPGRGIDQAIRTLVYLPDLQLAVLGPRQEATLKRTTELAEKLGVRQRLHIVDPVSPEGVGTYIASADVSLILLRNTCLNHMFCFPNKLLQSLLSGLPVVASRLVELERMVAMTGAGLIADETDPAAIGEAVRRILSEPERFRPTPTLIRSLELSHGWTTQKKNLVALYHALSGLPTDDVDHRSPSVRRGAPILSSGPSV
ncbi:MAG: glycosyltransferase, partial [Pseudomonadota bacterium]